MGYVTIEDDIGRLGKSRGPYCCKKYADRGDLRSGLGACSGRMGLLHSVRFSC